MPFSLQLRLPGFQVGQLWETPSQSMPSVGSLNVHASYSSGIRNRPEEKHVATQSLHYFFITKVPRLGGGERGRVGVERLLYLMNKCLVVFFGSSLKNFEHLANVFPISHVP